MRIFDRKKEKTNDQLMLSPIGEKPRYDIWAALSKALLVFMLSYGAVGGFLSAYGMEYNKALSIAGCLAFSLLMSFIYETGVKWFTNLAVIGIFCIYAYVAVSNFWMLNSGAYAIINRIYEVAQSYLGIVDGGSFQLRTDDTYAAVTGIALFVEIVLVILMVIRLQYKASLLRIFCMTFLVFLVPIYFEKTPDLTELFFLIAGYATVFLVQRSGIREHISGQIRISLPVGIACGAVIVLLAGMLMPRNVYRRTVQPNSIKSSSEEFAMKLAQYGIMALLMDDGSGGGVSGGYLGRNRVYMPDYETDLIVRYTPYSEDPVYLKAYTGWRYDGERWLSVKSFGEHEGLMLPTVNARKRLYQEDSAKQSKGIMEIVNVDGGLEYNFLPYYCDGEAIDMNFEPGTGMHYRYEYYPVVTDVKPDKRSSDQPQREYLEITRICYSAVEQVCEEAGFRGNGRQIADQIVDYFAQNYTYTLREGYYFGGMDYISYFLMRNKKGRCTHFASAATMLFRYMGIPARYCEGYVFTYADAVLDGEMVDGEYKDYYDGYSRIGETAVLEVEIPDDHAHAWVEIYLPDEGWVIVDPTPAATEEEDVGNFWDAFLNGMNGGGDGEDEDGDLQGVLENALAGSAWIVAVVIGAILLFLAGKWGYLKVREVGLSEEERLKLEYGRLTAYLKNHYEDFEKLTTAAEELEWIALHYEGQIPDGMKEELYRAFFGPTKINDGGTLRKKVVAIRRKVKLRKAKILS